MADTTLIIRKADNGDIASLTYLVNELGYKTTQEEMQHRLENIYQQPNYNTLVACFKGIITGMVGTSLNYFYEQNGTYVRIVVLVTHSDYRRKGIGKALLEAVESWARHMGATCILLNCGNRKERKTAHDFYCKRGFAAKSTGYFKLL
ncbi:MAG: GNAT family N-acetyltransferase [Bacteroidota bacterium]|nr:GNAT family N-acetyltransferase [Bacteroidota bacterium]